MWGQKAKTRNWCWRKNWCHRKNHLFAPADPPTPTPRHSVSSQGLRIPPQSLVSACPRFLLWNFISTWTEESVFCFHDQYEMMGERRKWCKKRTISWLMKQELTWDKAFTESTRLLRFFLVYLSICRLQCWLYWEDKTTLTWKENHCCLQTYEAKKSSLSLAWMNCKSFEVLNFVFNCVTAHPLCSSNDLQLVSPLKFQASENLRCQICPDYDISQAT